MEIKEGRLERVYMGGTGQMYLLHGNNGDTYIYKPAVAKFSGKVEPFRGIVQECVYEIQKIVDPESAVACKYVDAGNLQGSVQELISTKENSPNYYWMQRDENSVFTDGEIRQFMREFVTDYLACNFDSHGNNFITDENGVIRGVDKEQAFRYLNDPRSLKPDMDYHPNIAYGENEPIYNTLFRRYIEGKVDIDFSVVSSCMDRVDAYNNDDYRRIFMPYCEACSVAFGDDALQKANKILDRKINMRTNIETFFQNLTELRNINLSQKGK